MKKSTKFIILLSVMALVYSCGQKHSGFSKAEAEHLRNKFDSCVAFLNAHRMDATHNTDSIAKVYEIIKNTPRSILTDEQRTKQLLSYQNRADVYMLANRQDSMLLTLNEGMRMAESMKDSTAIATFYIKMLCLYSAWNLEEQTHYYIRKCMDNMQHLDNSKRLHAYLTAAGAYMTWSKADSALIYIDNADSLVRNAEALRLDIPAEMSYLHSYMKGWAYSCIPDSAAAALRTLSPIHTQMEPIKEKVTGFDIVCYNIARAHDALGNTTAAQRFYDEALEIVLKNRMFVNFDAAKWLMEHYLKTNDKQRQLQLLPVWEELQRKVYSSNNATFLTAYNVQFRTAEQQQIIERHKWELHKKQLTNYVFICIIIILLLVCAWGAWFWQVRKRKMRKLFEAIMFRYAEWHNMMLEVRNGEVPLISVNAIGPNILLGSQENNEANGMTDESIPAVENSNKATANEQRENNGNNFNKYHALYRKVLAVMEKEKPFVNPRLTIDGLARIVGTNRTDISSCINSMSHCNFSHWIAVYRVNYLLELHMRDKSKPFESFITEAGFASRSSFYRQFKTVTGLTPTQFKNFSGKKDA